MSDTDLLRTLDELEQLLQGDLLDAEGIAAWRQRFDAALAAAARGPEWPAIVARTRELAARLDAAAGLISEQQDQIRKRLDHQARGARALKGYKPA